MRYKVTTQWAMAMAVAVVVAAASSSAFARHPDTAEYYLAYAEEHLDKEIQLDVSHVEPVHFVSPSEQVSFLRVATVDEGQKKRFGGMIMMVLPVEDKDKVIKKYGLNHERGRSKPMKVVLRKSPGAGPRPPHYLADYQGKAWHLVKDKMSTWDFEADGPRKVPGHGR